MGQIANRMLLEFLIKINEKRKEKNKEKQSKNGKSKENEMMSIEAARAGFEESFKEAEFYNKQTQDEKHLNDILDMLEINSGTKILDLGCGSGYLTFPIAKLNSKIDVIGLDIVRDTLKNNSMKAQQMGLNNVEFVSYDGTKFPFENGTFDLVVTRYALHHFPEIEKSMGEVARVLKSNGRFFISDPRPNDCDSTRFVDDYMQLKKDGHMKFYTKDEWVQLCGEYDLQLINSFDSSIRFPRKKIMAEGYKEVLDRHETLIIESYRLEETKEELWITEQVNNLLFVRR